MSIENVTALIPASGFATRLAPMPCSKELVPIGRVQDEQGIWRPKPSGAYLLDHFDEAGIERAIWLLRPGKEDVAARFPSRHGSVALAHVFLPPTPSSVHTLDVAYPFVRGKICALGFPDILLPKCNAYARVLDVLFHSNADVVLGTFPTEQPTQVDVVEASPDGVVHGLRMKPEEPVADPRTWAVAVWSAEFSDFLHGWLQSTTTLQRELYVGDVILAGRERGMAVRAVPLADEPSIDVGTPEGLRIARLRYNGALT